MDDLTPTDDGTVNFGRVALGLCDRFREFPGSHLAPEIPRASLVLALQSYLDLGEGEELLAVLRTKAQDPAGASCVLTTRRICWPGRSGAERGRSLAYEDLPATIGRTGGNSSAVDLGEGRTIGLGGRRPIQDRLIRFLEEIGPLARGETNPPEIPENVRRRVDFVWTSVPHQSADARAIQADLRQFRGLLVQSVPVLTPVIFAACLLIYLAMLASGVSAMKPENEAMHAWGAIFGPSVVFEHQYWRLFTSMFLHFGFVHLALNLWCLISAGPTVERLYGRTSFGALYLIAGLGGAIASTWAHPTYISAGASGAIFGIFGGLLGYLAVRHRDVPASMLKPMRSSATAFLGYNLVFGLTDPQIDMAAHLGGLAAGFVAGLGLTMALPRPGRASGWSVAIRRLGVVAVLGAGLTLVGGWVFHSASAKILADPELGPAVQGEVIYGPQWNEFHAAVAPAVDEFDAITTAINGAANDFDRGIPAATLIPKLDRLLVRLADLDSRVAGLPANNDEIVRMRGHLVSARTRMVAAATSLANFFRTNDPAPMLGPTGFEESCQAYTKDFEEFGKLREEYFRVHKLTLAKPK